MDICFLVGRKRKREQAQSKGVNQGRDNQIFLLCLSGKSENICFLVGIQKTCEQAQLNIQLSYGKKKEEITTLFCYVCQEKVCISVSLFGATKRVSKHN